METHGRTQTTRALAGSVLMSLVVSFAIGQTMAGQGNIVASPGASLIASPAATPVATPLLFDPQVQVDANGPINLKNAPSSTGIAVIALPPDTPLEIADEDDRDEEPGQQSAAGSEEWVRVRTADGTTGWVREIDLGPYRP